MACMREQCRIFCKLQVMSSYVFVNCIFIPLGSSPTFLIALFVMCIACLAGTAVMIFKKSRDKSAGYAVLVSGEQE